MSAGIAPGRDANRADPASTLVSAWVRFYTVGMSGPRRERRREQVANDVWEHRSDRLAAGHPLAAVSLEVIGRWLRGIPEDVLWRYQVEGLAMNIQFSVNRVVGATFVAMMLFLTIGGSIQGYDASRQGFEGELERAARASGGWNVTVFLIAGVGLLAAAAAVLIAFGERSRKLALLSAIGLAATGILVLISTALYGAFASLADDFVAASADDKGALLANARTLLLVLDGTAGVTTLLGCISVWGIALMVTRLAIVPKWFNVFIGFSAVGVLMLIVGEAIGPDELAWPGFGLAVLGVALWLIFAGAWMALGGGTVALPSGPPSRGRTAAPPSLIATIAISLVAIALPVAVVGTGGWAIGLIATPIAAALAIGAIVLRAKSRQAPV